MRFARLFVPLLAALPLGLGAPACKTSTAVREAVVETNAALVSPYLTLAGHDAEGDWREALAQLDALIQENLDQPTLVAHLRVRQAMLLTVAGRDDLAGAVWNEVDSQALVRARDKTLFAQRDVLMWWYSRAPRPGPLDAAERARAERAYAALDTAATEATGADELDLRLYLGTLGAQMALKLHRGVDTEDPAAAAAVRSALVADLARYVAFFPSADVVWVRASPDVDLEDGAGIADLRHRIWLREIAREFRRAGDDLALDPPPAWDPPWVAAL